MASEVVTTPPSPGATLKRKKSKKDVKDTDSTPVEDDNAVPLASEEDERERKRRKKEDKMKRRKEKAEAKVAKALEKASTACMSCLLQESLLYAKSRYPLQLLSYSKR